MKKLFAVVIMLAMLVGCAIGTGIVANPVVNIAIDGAFYLELKTHPQYKAPVIAGLTAVKVFLSGSVTYDQLILEITKQFPGDAAALGIILSKYIATDKPIFETYLPMLESYKAAIIVKIDEFLLLANVIK